MRSSVSSTLAPLLDHPDEDCSLAPAQCAATLNAITDQRQHGDRGPRP